jgi:diguanylate cyclase (GGDEF)-like protein
MSALRAAHAPTTDRTAALARRLRPLLDPLAIGLPALALLGALVWLGVSFADTRREARAAVAEAQRIAELRGEIVHLDELLTMSARMAAATGDDRWQRRYEAAEPLLDAAIQAAIALSSPEAAAELARKTDAANRRLVEIERLAFDHVRAGYAPAAATLLDGAEYETLKGVYASGIAAFSADLAHRAEVRGQALDRRGHLQAAALVAVLLAAVMLGLRWHVRLRSSLLRTEDVARTDALTGLRNRRALLEHMEAALRTESDGPPACAVVLLDLDGFKAVNDALGHGRGDALLRAVAGRLSGCIRASDIAARLGGDEFAVLLRPATPGAGGEEVRAAALSVAERIVETMAEPFDLAGGDAPIRIGASVGVAIAPLHAATPDRLLHAADLALYDAKQRGRGRLAVFAPDLEATSRARAELDADLRAAVEAGAIEPHFQPMADLRDGKVVGYEMLARWDRPGHGRMPPDIFIPAAERLGLIGQLTDTLLHRACRIAARWPAQESVACNLSPLLLRDRAWLLDAVARALAASGLPPQRLELELTESALVGDLTIAREVIDALRETGVRVALDDFGTGYSGLRLLSALRVDRLKIDRSFVARMHEDEASARIVACVVALAQGLGLSIVAEGIEQAVDAQVLHDLGCTEGQGWLFGRPAPAEAIAAQAMAALVGRAA